MSLVGFFCHAGIWYMNLAGLENSG